MKKLEQIHIRPLSEEERSRAWNNIAARIPSTPVLSPFVFPVRKALSMAVVFVFIVGTVGASNSARPGQVLFPLDVAIERVESSLDSSSQADHARERLAEFDQIVGVEGTETQVANDAAQAPIPVRMEKSAPPQADTTMMFAAMEAPEPVRLSDEVEQAIEKTRTELEKILNAATFKGDTETVIKITATIEEFETKVRMMRGQ